MLTQNDNNYFVQCTYGLGVTNIHYFNKKLLVLQNTNVLVPSKPQGLKFFTALT